MAERNAGKPGFSEEVNAVAAKAELELDRLIRYLNDEVVPDVRRHSSTALRTAAERLRELAETLDNRRP